MRIATMPDAALLERDRIADAVHVLKQAYGDFAASEALMRALVHERADDCAEAALWANVYLAIRRVLT